MRATLLLLATSVIAASRASTDDPLGVEGLAEELQTRGATVAVRRSPYAPYEELSGSRWLLCINGYGALAFEYPSEGDRRTEADGAAPTFQGEIDLFWGTIGWWGTSNVLVSFHYEPTRPGPMVGLLEDTMGPEMGRTGFAFGSAPDEIPLSENCT